MFSNAKHASEWKFYFSLESGLGANLYINLDTTDENILSGTKDDSSGNLYVRPASIYEYGTTTKVGTTTMSHTSSTSVYSF
jgi:hypothetical protein